MPDIAVLNVILHGQAIGTLTRLPGERMLFAFDPDYIDDPNRATLSLSFKDALGALITDIRPTQTRLPPFFSNLLPEGPLRDYLAGRAGVNAQREFFLLGVLGRDLPGALTLVPAGTVLLPGRGDAGNAHAREGQETALRFSLAGVQLKFSAVMESTGGLTIPAEGVGGSWIVKLPSMTFAGVPENEFAMMTLARMAGIDVPDVRLVDVASIAGMPEGMGRLQGSALAVKRFDRTGDGGRVHSEDFAQVFGVYPEKKYARASYRNLAEVIWAEIGAEGIAEFVRRLVFNVIIGNADMHLKNWSLIYPDQRQAALAPGYDFVSTIAYIDDGNMALNLVKSKSMAAVSLDSLIQFAAKARLPEKLVLDSAAEAVERFRIVWMRERKHLPLTTEMLRIIDAHVSTIALVKELWKA